MSLELSDGTRTPIIIPDYPGGQHDCLEVARRNTYIRIAEPVALEKAGDPESIGFGDRFTRAFSTEMDRLCK